MGALHEGHISLIRKAKESCDKIFVSIFVNPTQFAPHEDFDKYPSTLDRDLELLNETGLVHALFVPSPIEMYPSFTIKNGVRDNGQSVFVVPRNIENLTAEAKSRPNFFTGVSTVCTKLFNIIQPNKAYFGQKDAIQAITLKTITKELNIPIDINIVDTMREYDGLAMSSRNVYLSKEDRAIAPIIYKGLQLANKEFKNKNGFIEVKHIKDIVIYVLLSNPNVSIDYVSVANGETGQELDDDYICTSSTLLLSVAVKIGNTRLIDNIILNNQ
jgi:pantoate--beta-alanine ligase